MRRQHLIAGAVTAAALAGGAAGAVAATDDHKAAEQSILSDAAKRLGVSADELRSALSKAEDAQLDAEVKAGRLTQAQADAIKQHRRADGTVLGPGGPGGPGGTSARAATATAGPAARSCSATPRKAIGIGEDALVTQLRDGKSLAAIAKAHGKTLADVKAAVKAAATKRLDADLKAGRITQAQRDELAGHLDEAIDHLGDARDRGPHGPGPWDHDDDRP